MKGGGSVKLLDRNKISFHYCLYESKTQSLDEYGNVTGEYKIRYSEPKSMRANISPAKGNVQVEQFGSDVVYDKTIVTDDMNCPLNEYSVLFVDTPVTKDIEDNYLYDYVVVKVAKSLNTIAYAIRKAGVS